MINVFFYNKLPLYLVTSVALATLTACGNSDDTTSEHTPELPSQVSPSKTQSISSEKKSDVIKDVVKKDTGESKTSASNTPNNNAPDNNIPEYNANVTVFTYQNHIVEQQLITAQKKPAVAIKVVNKDNLPLKNANILIANKALKTNNDGTVVVDLANTSTQALVIKKPGYITTAKQVTPIADKTMELTVKLRADQMTKTFKTSSGVTAKLESGAVVSIPKNAIQKPDGTDYIGNVTLATSYYSPETLEGVDTFARPYRGVNSDGSNEVGLISVGVIEAKLTDDKGQPLQLKEGSEATLSVPANSVSANETNIPLWYYDETKKIWVQEGKVTKQADGSYSGTVKHFTLWNVDIPISSDRLATIQGCYVDKNKQPTPYQFGVIRTTGWESGGGSNLMGKFSVQVPAGKSLELLSFFGDKHFPPVKIKPLTAGENRQLDCITVKDAAKKLSINKLLSIPNIPTMFTEPNQSTGDSSNTNNQAVTSGSISVGSDTFKTTNTDKKPSFSMLLTSGINSYTFYGAEKDGKRDEVSVWLSPSTAAPIFFSHKLAGAKTGFSCGYLHIGASEKVCKGINVIIGTDRKSLSVSFNNTKVFHDNKNKTVTGKLTTVFPQAMKYLKVKDLSSNVKTNLTIDDKPYKIFSVNQNGVKDVNGKTEHDFDFLLRNTNLPSYNLEVKSGSKYDNELIDSKENTKYECEPTSDGCKNVIINRKDNNIIFNFNNASYLQSSDVNKKHTVNGSITVPSESANLNTDKGNLRCDPFTCSSKVMVSYKENNYTYLITLDSSSSKNNGGISQVIFDQDLYYPNKQQFSIQLNNQMYFCSNTSPANARYKSVPCNGISLSADGLKVTLKDAKLYDYFAQNFITMNGSFTIRGL